MVLVIQSNSRREKRVKNAYVFVNYVNETEEPREMWISYIQGIDRHNKLEYSLIHYTSTKAFVGNDYLTSMSLLDCLCIL